MSAETVIMQDRFQNLQATSAAFSSSQQYTCGQKACPTPAASSAVAWMVKDFGKARIQIKQERQDRLLPVCMTTRGLSQKFTHMIEEGLIETGRWYTSKELAKIVNKPSRNVSAVLCYHSKLGDVEKRHTMASKPTEWRFNS